MTNEKEWEDTLQETNISPKNGILKMIFLFPRWDMLIPWRIRVLAMLPPFPPKTFSESWAPGLGETVRRWTALCQVPRPSVFWSSHISYITYLHNAFTSTTTFWINAAMIILDFTVILTLMMFYLWADHAWKDRATSWGCFPSPETSGIRQLHPLSDWFDSWKWQLKQAIVSCMKYAYYFLIHVQEMLAQVFSLFLVLDIEMQLLYMISQYLYLYSSIV